MLTMDLGQRRRRPQSHTLSKGFQYGENPMISRQSSQQMISHDGLPRGLSDQHFIATTPALPLPAQSYSLTNSMTELPQPTTLWSNQSVTQWNYDDQTPNGYCKNSATVVANSQNNFSHGSYYPDLPRTWASYDPQILNDDNGTMDQSEPIYTMEDENNHGPKSPALSAPDFDDPNGPQPYSHITLCQSPKMEDEAPGSRLGDFDQSARFSPPPNDDSEDGGMMSREMTAMDVDDQATDEPYAKLIHRALMSAPNHSMVLQEIYQWFRENTTKGSADSKGWMNSIRHNLSMNAAFKKTERKVTGDETKKSTEWVLAEFAVKDGVQSTTRYRKGTGAKKFLKSENPAPARQSSGRKGGISASKTKLLRQRIRDERNDQRRLLYRQEMLRSNYSTSVRSSITNRHNSPSTPPHHEQMGLGSPYFQPNAKPGIHFEGPLDDICSLGQVQGVYLDGAPVFTDQHDGPGYFDGISHYQ